MRVSDLRRAGHAPSLAAAFMHFEASFMCWVLIGALGIAISEDLGLAAWAKGLAVGIPLDRGFGVPTDRRTRRRQARPPSDGCGDARAHAPSRCCGDGSARVRSPSCSRVGVLLGVAGSSFAVALPLAGRAYEPKMRGLAMGIAGAGNSGTVVSALLAPRIAAHIGWHGVLGLAIIPISLVFVAFLLLTRNSPSVAGPRGAAAP